MLHRLIVLPDDTAKPFLDAINNEKQSIRVKMFLFSHPDLIDVIVQAKKHGVHVRVMSVLRLPEAESRPHLPKAPTPKVRGVTCVTVPIISTAIIHTLIRQPIPLSGMFNLTVRSYQPEQGLLDGTYKLPAVTKVQ